jgi:hypothetical protein
MDIYVDRDGTIYVTDQIPRITMYSPDGRMLARGRPVTIGAHGLWGDSRGSLYLAEVGVNQVTNWCGGRRRADRLTASGEGFMRDVHEQVPAPRCVHDLNWYGVREVGFPDD